MRKFTWLAVPGLFLLLTSVPSVVLAQIEEIIVTAQKREQSVQEPKEQNQR